MKIIIPTNREIIKTLNIFPDAEVFRNNLGVVGARNHILDNNNGVVLMLDDDLLDFSKKVSPKKYVKCKEPTECFDYHLSLMEKFNTPFLGIGSSVAGVRQTKEPVLFGRAFSSYYVDCDKFKELGIRFDEEAVLFEDFEITLQLIDKDLLPAVSYKYSANFDHWQEGGVSSVRNIERCTNSCKYILNKWAKYGKFISIVRNKKSNLPEPRFKFKQLLRYKGYSV